LLLAQPVSLTAHPGRRSVSEPLRYILSTHTLEHSIAASGAVLPGSTVNLTSMLVWRRGGRDPESDWRSAGLPMD